MGLGFLKVKRSSFYQNIWNLCYHSTGGRKLIRLTVTTTVVEMWLSLHCQLSNLERFKHTWHLTIVLNTFLLSANFWKVHLLRLISYWLYFIYQIASIKWQAISDNHTACHCLPTNAVGVTRCIFGTDFIRHSATGAFFVFQAITVAFKFPFSECKFWPASSHC